MSRKILCVYYSRTGKTRDSMAAIAQALNAELVEITDGVKRRGLIGFFRSGMDAVRKSTRFLEPYETKYPIEDYDLVIVGTPVWAGRCSSIAREFLKKNGKRCKKIAYVITRSAENERYESVFDQMDLYTETPRICAVSLRGGDVGEAFWREEFLKDLQRALDEE